MMLSRLCSLSSLLVVGLSLGFVGARLAAQTAASPAGLRTISGVVLNARTGHPLAAAEVSLYDERAASSAGQRVTDSQGLFSFTGLKDSKYSLLAVHAGYVRSHYQEHAGGISTAIVTGDGLDTTHLRMELQPQGVIYGVVSDDSGDPVPRARLSLYRRDVQGGTGKMVRAGQANADSAGNYDIPKLEPGDYYLCAAGTPWYATQRRQVFRQELAQPGQPSQPRELPRSPLDVAYALTCHPGTTDWSAAEPIEVKAGDRVPVDVTMHAVPAVHLTMQIPWPAGKHGITLPQVRTEAFGFSDSTQPMFAGLIPPDTPSGKGMATVEMTGIAPGQYGLEFRGDNGSASRVMSLDATSERVAVDTAVAVPEAAVTGKIVMAGGEPLPDQLWIQFTPVQNDDARGARVTSDGSFTMAALPPGDYQVMLGASRGPMTVTRMEAKGATARGPILTVANDAITLSIAVTEPSGSLSGVVNRSGQPASGVFVVLVPRNRNQAPRSNQSDSDGTFDFPHLPAGEYTLVAIEDGWTLEWARRDALANYLANGVKVIVPPQSKHIDVKEALEVQAK